MHIKKYQAKDMRRALKKISDDLGPDAVILSNQKTDEGVELWASLGEVSALTNTDSASDVALTGATGNQDHMAQGEKPSKRQNIVEAKRSRHQLNDEIIKIKRQRKKYNDDNEDQVSIKNRKASGQSHSQRNQAKESQSLSLGLTEKNEKAIQGLEVGMNLVRNDLKRQEVMISKLLSSIRMEELRSQEPHTGSLDAIEQQLEIIGLISQPIKQAIKRQLSYQNSSINSIDSWDNTIDVISEMLTLIQNDLWCQNEESKSITRRRYVLMGPTGVGKTTTIGKLAHRYIKDNHQPSSIALVTTDLDNDGSVELLKSYAKKLGCTFCKVAPGQQLEKAVRKLSNKSLILIDTPGLTSSDPRWSTYKRGILSLENEIKPILVLPSTVQWRLLENIVKEYSALSPEIAVISKLDECVSLGEVLDVVIRHHLRIAYVTDGISLANDIHLPKANELIGFAKHLGEQSNSDIRMERDVLGDGPVTGAVIDPVDVF